MDALDSLFSQLSSSSDHPAPGNCLFHSKQNKCSKRNWFQECWQPFYEPPARTENEAKPYHAAMLSLGEKIYNTEFNLAKVREAKLSGNKTLEEHHLGAAWEKSSEYHELMREMEYENQWKTKYYVNPYKEPEKSEMFPKPDKNPDFELRHPRIQEYTNHLKCELMNFRRDD